MSNLSHIHPRPRHTNPHRCARIHTASELALRKAVRDRCKWFGLTVDQTREVTQLAMRVAAKESSWRAIQAAGQRARELGNWSRGMYRYGDDAPGAA